LSEASQVVRILGILAAAVVVPANLVEEDGTVPVEVPWHLGAGEDVDARLGVGLLAPVAGREGRVAVVGGGAKGGGLHAKDYLRELLTDDVGAKRDGGLEELDLSRGANGQR
jgi:hypothetical protein